MSTIGYPNPKIKFEFQECWYSYVEKQFSSYSLTINETNQKFKVLSYNLCDLEKDVTILVN